MTRIGKHAGCGRFLHDRRASQRISGQKFSAVVYRKGNDAVEFTPVDIASLLDRMRGIFVSASNRPTLRLLDSSDRYRRNLQDLPVQGKPVTLHLAASG